MNDIIKQFNEISIDFLTQTSDVVGSSYLYKFKLMTKVNSIFAIDLFINRVIPHRTKIIDRDETFFMNRTMGSDDPYADYMDDIIGIKKIYHTLDTESKNNIWDIVLALLYLAEERVLLNSKKNNYTNVNYQS